MKRRDFILIGVILAVALILFGVIELTKEEGAYVIVRIDGNEAARYSLSENGEYSLNDGTNVLRIEDGKAYLTDANCPDHLCVKRGKVYRNGETITCLPNKLTVTVYGVENSDNVDLIS